MIDAKKIYRTRCGYSVRIYATDGAKPCVVHGAVYVRGTAAQPHGWALEAWHGDGRSAANDYEVDHFLDLIEVEETEIEETENETPANDAAAADC